MDRTLAERALKALRELKSEPMTVREWDIVNSIIGSLEALIIGTDGGE